MASSRKSEKSGMGASQRQLRVGELVRHELADMLNRGLVNDAAMKGALISISEVRMTPDLKRGIAFVSVFNGQDMQAILEVLNKASNRFRSLLGKQLTMKFTPDIVFREDTRFADDALIDDLLKSENVRRDLVQGEEN